LLGENWPPKKFRIKKVFFGFLFFLIDLFDLIFSYKMIFSKISQTHFHAIKTALSTKTIVSTLTLAKLHRYVICNDPFFYQPAI